MGSRVAPRAASSREAPRVEAQEELEMKIPDEDVSGEVHVCRKIPTPTTPSKEEVEEHNLLGHVQYRSWCAVCVASRGVGQRHTAVEEQP